MLHANHAMLLEGIVPVLSPAIGPDITEYQPIPDAGIVHSLITSNS